MRSAPALKELARSSAADVLLCKLMIPKGPESEAVQVWQVDPASGVRRRDQVAVEEPLEIRLISRQGGRWEEQSISVTMRTPGHDFELVAGFLFGEGIIKDCCDIEQLSYCLGTGKPEQEYNIVRVRLRPSLRFDALRLKRNFYTSSSCGVCGKSSLEALAIQGCVALSANGLRVASQTLSLMPKALLRKQQVFERTGGLHAAGLFDREGQLIGLYEDVGRHNAVDKLIGEQLLQGKTPLEHRLLLVSGRASFEILQKALMAKLPLVAAVGAPSSLAVSLAREYHITLVGFVRQERFNVYSGAERILNLANL